MTTLVSQITGASPDVRPIRASDKALLLSWRNDPWIVGFGASGKAVSIQEHDRWFAATLAGDDRRAMIAEMNGNPIGFVRFDRHLGADWEISIYLLSQHVGLGIGPGLIRKACERMAVDGFTGHVRATIRGDNPRSLRAFVKADFARKTESGQQHDGLIAMSRPMLAKVPHNRLTFGREEADAAAAAVASGWWACGPETSALEVEMAQATARKHGVAVGSGLAALRLALISLGVGEGHEVIVPAYSCVALANAVESLSAHALPADIDGDWNLSADAARRAMTPKTRAIIAVHTFGAPADIAGLAGLGLPVIEDCSHGYGPIGAGPTLGSEADVAVVSLHATKFTGCGEGGVVLANRDEIAKTVCDLRDYADKPPSGQRMNDKMSDIEAAVARCQLRRLPATCEARRHYASRYHEALQGAEERGVLRRPDIERTRIWYRYAVEVADGWAEKLGDFMGARGVETAQPVDDWHRGKTASWPRSRHAYGSLLSLPLYPTLREDEQQRVIEVLRAGVEQLP